LLNVIMKLLRTDIDNADKKNDNRTNYKVRNKANFLKKYLDVLLLLPRFEEKV